MEQKAQAKFCRKALFPHSWIKAGERINCCCLTINKLDQQWSTFLGQGPIKKEVCGLQDLPLSSSPALHRGETGRDILQGLFYCKLLLSVFPRCWGWRGCVGGPIYPHHCGQISRDVLQRNQPCKRPLLVTSQLCEYAGGGFWWSTASSIEIRLPCAPARPHHRDGSRESLTRLVF